MLKLVEKIRSLAKSGAPHSNRSCARALFVCRPARARAAHLLTRTHTPLRAAHDLSARGVSDASDWLFEKLNDGACCVCVYARAVCAAPRRAAYLPAPTDPTLPLFACAHARAPHARAQR